MIISPTFREMLGQASGPAGGPASTDAGGYEIISPGASGVNWIDFSHPRAGPYVNNVVQVSNINVGKNAPLSVAVTSSQGTHYYKVSSTSFGTTDYALSGPGWTSFTTGSTILVTAGQYVGFTFIMTNKAGTSTFTITDSFGTTVDTFLATVT